MIGTRYAQREIRFRSRLRIRILELDAFWERDTGSSFVDPRLTARLTVVFNSWVEVEDGQADFIGCHRP
jgi:hypothetical protein